MQDPERTKRISSDLMSSGGDAGFAQGVLIHLMVSLLCLFSRDLIALAPLLLRCQRRRWGLPAASTGLGGGHGLSVATHSISAVRASRKSGFFSDGNN